MQSLMLNFQPKLRLHPTIGLLGNELLPKLIGK